MRQVRTYGASARQMSRIWLHEHVCHLGNRGTDGKGLGKIPEVWGSRVMVIAWRLTL